MYCQRQRSGAAAVRAPATRGKCAIGLLVAIASYIVIVELAQCAATSLATSSY